MKITVEYSESIEVVPGLWRKVGIAIDNEVGEDFDQSGRLFTKEEIAQSLHNQAKEYVQRWHKEDRYYIDESVSYETKYSQPGLTPIVNSQPPVIQVDRPEVSMENEIRSCQSVKVLESYKFIVKNNTGLQKIYDEKFAELSK